MLDCICGLIEQEASGWVRQPPLGQVLQTLGFAYLVLYKQWICKIDIYIVDTLINTLFVPS